MVDTDVPASVMVLFQSIKDDVTEMRKENSMVCKLHTETLQQMVGWDRCSDMRSSCITENGIKFKEIFDRLGEIEGVGGDYIASKENMVTKDKLAHAEGVIGDKSRAGDDRVLMAINQLRVDYDKRFTYLEDRARWIDFTWKTVWGNSVLKTVIGGGAFAGVIGLGGVYWGRVGQYGVIDVAIIAACVVVSLIVYWSFSNRSRIMKSVFG